MESSKIDKRNYFYFYFSRVASSSRCDVLIYNIVTDTVTTGHATQDTGHGPDTVFWLSYYKKYKTEFEEIEFFSCLNFFNCGGFKINKSWRFFNGVN